MSEPNGRSGQTFESESFDLVVHMDVMEHVNDPAAVMRETRRTLRPNGWQVFSAPTHKDFLVSRQIARNTPEGETILEGQAEYHGNPISGQGSLVTWRLGYDFANIVTRCGFDVTVLRFDAPTLGLFGEFTEIYVCQKR